MNGCHNCMGCCIHAQVEERKKLVEYKDDNGKVWMKCLEHDSYRHFCDKNPEGFGKWHEEHKHDAYDTYKDFTMDCYEPTETSRLMKEIIDLSNKILNK